MLPVSGKRKGNPLSVPSFVSCFPREKGIAFFAPFVLLGVGAIRQNVGTPKKRVKK
jgi:hypothetical protein